MVKGRRKRGEGKWWKVGGRKEKEDSKGKREWIKVINAWMYGLRVLN